MGENVFEAQEKRPTFFVAQYITTYFYVLFFLLLVTAISALIQSQPVNYNAANAVEADTAISVNVADACSITNTIEINKQHTATVQANSYTSDIGETLISVNCNDISGYSVYVVGYTNDTEGANTLTGSNTGLTIPTGTSVDATTSNWAMKLIPVSGIDAPTILSDNNGSFASYHIIPATATKVATLANSTESSSEFKTTYAVAISASQSADSYTGQVKYTLVHPSYANADGNVYMQNFTLADCQQNVGVNGNPANVGDEMTLRDRRDNNEYTVRYINGACWMTQNLRIAGTINKQYSNFSRVDNFNPCENDLTAGQSYDEPRCHVSEDDTYGVWYNFAAASAGQITGSSNYTNATEDICPSGWRLPQDGSGAGQTRNITSSTVYAAAFNPVGGGSYWDKTNDGSVNGYWWSSTAQGNPYRYYIYYDGTNLINSPNGWWGIYRFGGYYIRCVRLQ